MHADFLATLNCRWLYSVLLCAALLLGSRTACGEVYQAQDEGLPAFFAALSVSLGLPVVTSRAVASRQVSGAFDFAAPQQVIETLAAREGLIWHSDGQVLHVYAADEARSSAVALQHISVDRLRGIMRRAGLDEPRYPLRANGARMFYVSGPPSYVDHILRLTQLMDRPPRKAPERPPAFGVVQVVNFPVEDHPHGVGTNRGRVPGMLSMIQARLSQAQRVQLADGRLALLAYPDTNSVLIKGSHAQVKVIEKLLAELDVAQVLSETLPGQAHAGGGYSQAGPPQLTAAQYERVQRAFLRTEREFSP